MAQSGSEKLREVGARIREMREICGFTEAQMAEKAEVSLADYLNYEDGNLDFPFTFIYKCSHIFGVGTTDLLEGQTGAHLSSYTVTRKGGGLETAREEGIEIKNLASKFSNKIGSPYLVKYEYDEALQNAPIHTTTHSGQEFDYVLKGRLKVQVGDNVEYLSEGDSIYYNSSEPHGMIAVGGEDCDFIAIVLPGEKKEEELVRATLAPTREELRVSGIAAEFVDTVTDENGVLREITFKNENKFNFAFDVVDELGRTKPDKLAMLHIAEDGTERRFTFRDMKRESSRAANYFKSLGIKRGDRVMLVLRRRFQFWFAILGLHKIGAIAIPATDQLQVHDFEYRFDTAGVSAVICTGDATAKAIEEAEQKCGIPLLKIKVGEKRDGWHDFDEECEIYSTHVKRTDLSPCGDDPMLMFFTSGTTGYPKIAVHSYKYPLGHYITAKYWHGVSENGLHFTISETGWGKALWGKLYGQWLAEGAVFTYDFGRFDAADILPMFAKYHITSFCAPPTMLRMMIRDDISKYDLSSIVHMTTAGEALNPEVFKKFYEATGLRIHEAFGQTETTMSIGNLIGEDIKVGSMGKASPLYEIELMDADGNFAAPGENGEIVIKVGEKAPCGLFKGYYNDPDATDAVMHDGWYHTRDVAWRDEDGYFWYVGRTDDVIKSSGYRIGPFEIENVIMELPYVLECGVSAAPDPIRGQVIKASIVLVPGKEGTEELKKEIQSYVKANTAPYKYPRIVVFRDELPKTISGKIIRNML